MDVSLSNILLLGLTAIAQIVLGTIVYKKNPKALLNRLVAGFTFVVSLWTLVTLMILFQQEYGPLLFWVRVSHAIGVFFPWFVLALIFSFQEKEYPTRFILGLLYTTLVMAALSMTPLFIAGIDVPLEQKDPIYGPLFFLFMLFFIITILFAVYLAIRQLRTVRGIARLQIRYFIGGIILSFIMGAMSNVFLPLLGHPGMDMRSYGPVFGLFMAASMTYSIVKYRLMDIHMALRRVIVYTLTIGLLGSAFALPLVLVSARPTFPNPPFIALIVSLAMLVAFFFQPTREWIRTTLVDRYMYPDSYNYYNTLREASRAMVTILNLDKLLDYAITKVVDTAQIQHATFYLRDETEGPYESRAVRILPHAPAHEHPAHLETSNPLMLYLETHDDVLLRSDLRGNLTAQEQVVANTLDELEAEAAVPIVMESELNGAFILGPKGSGEPYSKEDVNMMLALSSQLGVALKNAQFHREVTGMKQYLENVLENMRNGLITVDSLGLVITFNGAAERITGLPSTKVLGRPVEEVLNPELSLFIKQTLLQGQGLGEVEFTIPAEDGSWRFWNCSTAMVDLSNNERGVILVLSDITWQKELEKEKNKAEKLASLGELAAGMAHEIKNPLVSIKTFAELLPKRYDEEDFRYNFSRVVGSEIERINSLVAKLLSFARDSEQHLERVDVIDLLDEIFLLLSPQLDTYQIQLNKYFDPHLPPVWADRNQLKQAFYNICQNSVEAMTKGGQLAVEAVWLPEKKGSRSKTARSREAVDRKKGLIKLTIQDTGEGISLQKQEKIFNPFFTTKSYGVGIGLSISHRIITDCGGEIKLQSTEGKGTLFEVVLPASSDRRREPVRKGAPEKHWEHHTSGGTQL